MANQERRRNIDNANKLENLIFQTEKTINEHGDKIDPENLNSLNSEIGVAKSLLEEKNYEEISSMIDGFEQKMQEAVAQMYQKAAEQQMQQDPSAEPAAEESSFENNEEDVIDAVFEDS